MKKHKVVLTQPTEGWERVGNAMSTVYRWDGGEIVEVDWKDGRCRLQVPVQHGDILRVNIHPEKKPQISAFVMKPPADPVAAIAWQWGFYKKMRVSSFEELLEAVENCRTTSQLHYSPVISASIYQGAGVAVAYRTAMNWQRGVPFRWWVDETATPEEVERVIEKARRRGLSSEFNPPPTAKQAVVMV